MTAALTLHRQRAGFAAAVIGSVGFVGGGLVAPLTAIGEVTRTASIIFVVCGVLLVLISFWLNRRMKLIRGVELKLLNTKYQPSNSLAPARPMKSRRRLTVSTISVNLSTLSYSRPADSAFHLNSSKSQISSVLNFTDFTFSTAFNYKTSCLKPSSIHLAAC